MNNSPPSGTPATGSGIPEISSGAQELIKIAFNKDDEGTLALNRALSVALQDLAQLPLLARQADHVAIRQLLKRETLPDTFFKFCAAIANGVDIRLAEPLVGPRHGRNAPTEIAHSVFLGLGQTLAEVCRDPHDDPSSLGPPVGLALKRLAATSPGQLQHLLILHFLGNVLQDFFDSCQVRMQVPELPLETEPNLRGVDARAIADELFRRVTPGANGADVGLLQHELRNMLSEYSQ